jgi:hypothetical protein
MPRQASALIVLRQWSDKRQQHAYQQRRDEAER